MSEQLGRLHLGLAAPTDKLAADLSAGDKMISRYHDQWQRRMGDLSFTGIAANLKTELGIAESALSQSLRRMQQQVNTQKIKISVDTSGFDESGLLARIAKVTGKTIKVQTDLSELHDLNKLLDVKIAHIQETQRVVASTVIAPRVDLSGLQDLGKELDGVLSKLDQLNRTQSRFSFTTTGGGEIQRIKIDSSNLSKDVAHAVEQGYKAAQPSRLAQATGKVANAATSPLRAIARGALEGFGRDMTRDFSQGIAKSIEAAASGSIGSADLLGQKLGDRIASGIGGKLGKSLKREIQEQLRDAIGSVDIDREAGAITQSRQQRRVSRTSQGAQGLNTQRQQVERERISAASELAEIQQGLGGIDNQRGRLNQANSKLSDGLFAAQLSGNQVKASAIQRQLAESRQSLAQLEEIEANLSQRVPQLQAQIESLGKKRSDLTKSINALSPQHPQVLQEVANAVAGRKVKDSELPQILPADARLQKLGGTAAYNPYANTISVRRDLYNQIQSGQLSEQSYKELVHEARHGADAGFGSVSGVQAFQDGRLVKNRKYSKAEVAYAAPFVSQYAPHQQAKELSAYAAEYSIAKPLYQKAQEAVNLKQLQEQIGFGGTKFKKFSESELAQLQAGVTGSAPLTSAVTNQQNYNQSLMGQIYSATGKGRAPSDLSGKVAAQIDMLEQLQGKVSEYSKAPKVVHAEIADPWAVKSKLAEASVAINTLGNAAAKIARPVATAATTAYQFATGVENAVLPLVPFGKQLKGLGQSVGLPALAYSGIGMLPGGHAAQAALGAGARGLLSIPGSAVGGALTHAASGALSNVPMVGSHLATALSTLTGGAIDGSIAALAPVLVGKGALGLGQQAAKLALPGGAPKRAALAGEAAAQRAISGAKSLVSVDVSPLDALPGDAPKSVLSITEIKRQVANLSQSYKKIQELINAGSHKQAKYIAEGIDKNAQKLIEQAKAAETELGRNTPEGSQLFSIQGQIGRKRKLAQDKLRKIEQVEEPEAEVDEAESLRKIASRKKQFQKFSRSITRKTKVESYSAPEIPDPWVEAPTKYKPPVPSSFNPGAFQPNKPPVPSSFSPNGSSQAETSVAPSTQAARAAVSPAILNAARKSQALQEKLANFGAVAGAVEGTIKNQETINKVAAGESLKAESSVGKLGDRLKDLAGAGKLAIGAFAGFQIGTLIAGQLAGAAKEAIALTGEFEQLQIRLQAATGSLQSGSQKFGQLRSQARELGVSQFSALETGTRFAATTLGTELEGAPTDDFTNKALDIIKARGLNRQTSNGLSTAISQILGSKRVSTEELNQLRESGGLPDARSIGARSLGLTPTQFSKQLESGEGINSQKFVSAFLTQASSDSLLVKDAALDTQQSKLAKLQSAYEDLQATIGGGINPAFKAGVDAVTGGIDLLTKGIQIGSTVLIGFAIAQIPKLITGLYSLATAAAATRGGLASMAATGLKAGASMAGSVASFYLLGEAISIFGERMEDAGKKTREETTKIEQALNKLSSKETKITIDLPKTAGEIEGKDWGENFRIGFDKAVGNTVYGILNFATGQSKKPVFLKEEKEQEKSTALDEAVAQSKGLRGRVAGAFNQAKRAKAIDLELQQVSTEQSALFQNNPGDVAGARRLQERTRKLLAEKSSFAQPVSDAQTIVQQKLNQLKGEQDRILEQGRSKQISAGEYTRQLEVVGKAIKETTTLQEELNKSIKSPLDDLATYGRELDKLAARYEGLAAELQALDNAKKRQRNSDLISGRITEGQSNYKTAIEEQNNLILKIKGTEDSIKALVNQINTINPGQLEKTLKSYGLNFNTVSSNELKTIAESSSDTLDKKVLSQAAVLKDRIAELDNQKTQVSESQASLFKKLRDENKEIKDYYRSLEQSIDKNDLKSQTLLNQLTVAKNRFQVALAGFGDSLADGFFGALTELMQTADDEVRAKADQLKAKRSSQLKLQNQLIEIDYKKSVITSAAAPTTTAGLDDAIASPVAGYTLDQALAPRPMAIQRPEADRGGKRHNGVDLSGKPGTPVYSVLSGTAQLERNIPWGKNNQYNSEAAVTVTSMVDGKEVKIRYFHLGRDTVKSFRDGQQQEVRAGQQIGVIGSDGAVGGNDPHADIKIRENGARVADPQKYLANLARKRAARAKYEQPTGRSSSTGNFGSLSYYEGIEAESIEAATNRVRLGNIYDGQTEEQRAQNADRVAKIGKIVNGRLVLPAAKATSRTPAATGSTQGRQPLSMSGVDPNLLKATLDYIGQLESGGNYYAKNDGGSFPASEAATGFPASQSTKQRIRVKGGYESMYPNVGKYQFSIKDYQWAQKLDPSIRDFTPASQDRIAALKLFKLNRGGAELLNYQQSPTLENADALRYGLGREWEAFRDGKGQFYPGTDRRFDAWNRNGNSTQRFNQQLQRSLPRYNRRAGIDNEWLLASADNSVSDSGSFLLAQRSERRGFGDDPGAVNLGGSSFVGKPRSLSKPSGLGADATRRLQESAGTNTDTEKAIQDLRNNPIPTVKKTPIKRTPRTTYRGQPGSYKKEKTQAAQNELPPLDVPPVDQTPIAPPTTAQPLNTEGLSLLDKAAGLANEEKVLTDQVTDSKFAADLSTIELKKAQAQTNLRSQRRKASRSARDRQRTIDRSADNLSSPSTVLGRQLKAQQDLDNNISDSDQSYLDLKEELSNAVEKAKQTITQLEAKEGRTPQDQAALEETKVLLSDLSSRLGQLNRGADISQRAYSDARQNLSFNQTQESTDTSQSLDFRRKDAVLGLAQVAQQRQEEIDKRDAPFANQAALKIKEQNELRQEAIALERQIADIEKERRQYQGQNSDGKRLSDEELKRRRDIVLEARSKITGTDENAQLSRAALDRQLENINQIEELNQIEAASRYQSADRVALIKKRTANELADRSTARKNYESEYTLTGQSSKLAIAQAVNDQNKGFGLETRNQDYDLAVRSQSIEYARQRRALEAQKEGITETGTAADEARARIEELIKDLEKLNDIKLRGLADQLNPLNSALADTQKQFRSTLGEFVFGNGQFNIGKILGAGLTNLGGQLLDSVSTGLFSGLYQKKQGAVDTSKGGDWLGTGLGFLGKIFGFADGGSPNYDLTQAELERSNTPFGQAMRLERSRTGRRPVAIVANEGEVVLNAMQTKQWQNNIRNFDRGGAVGVKSTPLNLSPAGSVQFDYERIAATKDININVTGDASATTDPAAMKQMINAFRGIVTEELVNHKRQRSGLI
jgi:tape measure domain-containing protein